MNHAQLVFLSFCETMYNISNVTAILLLGHMIDKMTDCAKDNERYIEPILQKSVPFFVYLASIKLLNEHLKLSDVEDKTRTNSAESSSIGGSISYQNQRRGGYFSPQGKRSPTASS